MGRINPDVWIYDEGPLVAAMQRSEVWGVFANCLQERRCCTAARTKACMPPGSCFRVHTDFFAVRPERLPSDAFSSWKEQGNTETQATGAFSSLIKAGHAHWLAHWGTGSCRAQGGG